MDSLEAMQLIPPARTFWNSNDPTLDPFDETLMPTMASPLEAACSSTFLFPSTTGSTCDSGDSQVFKTQLSQQQSSMVFDEISIPVEEEGAESSRGLITSPPPELFHSTSAWLPAPPAHYHAAQGYARPLQQQQLQQEMTELEAKSKRLKEEGQVRVHLNHYGGSQLGPDLFGPLNASTTSTALDSSNVSKNHTAGPLMRQPSFRRPENAGPLRQQQQQQQQQQLNTVKASSQSSNMFELPRRSGVVSHKEPLGSPCSVISGFTKVADQFVSPDYTSMEISSSSFGPSTSAAANALDEAAVKYVSHSQESSTPEGGAHCMSGAQEIMVKQLTTKRKRSKLPKLSNEVESQRMTHIAVERNRRKQMNEHLAALRALMPGSYVQKGDQASIVGGAIEFVKELEHLLHCLQSQKRRRAYSDLSTTGTPTSRLATPNPEPQFCQLQPPFAFHSPQRLVDPSPFLLGASSTESINLGAGNIASTRHGPQLSGSYPAPGQMISIPASSSSTLQPWSLENGVVVGEARSDMASVEVKLVPVPVPVPGSSSSSDPAAALVKIMATRRAGQLLRTVVALESLALTVLHTNITTVGHTVLYSFHVQIGALCCTNVDEIARAVHQTFASLHALQF